MPGSAGGEEQPPVSDESRKGRRLHLLSRDSRVEGLQLWSCWLAAAAEPAPAAVCASGSAAPGAAGTVHMCKLAHKHKAVKHPN